MPGSDGLIKDEKEAIEVSRKIGFPVMIKATAGGGGRGMRLAMHEGEFLHLLQQATQVSVSHLLMHPLVQDALCTYRLPDSSHPQQRMSLLSRDAGVHSV